MPNNNSHGSPYKMKAGKMGPMQKNFGSELAINKKLDKKSMEGGMTGQPGNTLDGPLAKKSPMYKKGKNAVSPTNKKATTRKKNAGPLGGKAKRDSMLSDTNNDGNMITRGFAKAAANRKAKKTERALKKSQKGNSTFNNAKTEQGLKTNTTLKVNTKLNNTKVDKPPVKVDKPVKIDHNKGLKGKTGQARTNYYDKHKLKHDKTITTNKKKTKTNTIQARRS